MARVKDLWHAEVSDPDAPEPGPGESRRRIKEKTARHPDNGGNKDAKRWLAIWLDPDGREKTKAFAKTDAAKAYAKKMEADAERDEYVDPKSGDGKFGPLVERHLRLRGVGASTKERYSSLYRHHIEEVFGHRRVAAIRASDVAEWLISGDMRKLSAGAQEMAYLVVAGTFDLAVADKMRRDNPARSPIVTPPHGELRERDGWAVERVWQVRDEHPEPYRALIDCAAGLGLRRGCAAALSEDDFDYEACKVRIRRQVARIGNVAYFKLPKGGKERVVPLPRGVAASVNAHTAKFPPVACALPWMNEDGTIAEDPVTVPLLYPWRGTSSTGRRSDKTYGKPIVAGSYDASVWKPALSRLGIIPAPEKTARGIMRYKVGDAQDVGMHMLRHFYESMLDDGGVSLAGMMEFMGHSRKGQSITIGVYGHVTEETFERARNAVDQRLFKLRPVPSDGTVTELRAAR
jgi:integrase